MTAIAMGFGVRIGIEDSIWWDHRRENLSRNVDLVKRTHETIRLAGKELFPAIEFGSFGFYNRKK